MVIFRQKTTSLPRRICYCSEWQSPNLISIFLWFNAGTVMWSCTLWDQFVFQPTQLFLSQKFQTKSFSLEFDARWGLTRCDDQQNLINILKFAQSLYIASNVYFLLDGALKKCSWYFKRLHQASNIYHPQTMPRARSLRGSFWLKIRKIFVFTWKSIFFYPSRKLIIRLLSHWWRTEFRNRL